MTRFNQINARSAALSLSIAALALVVTTNTGHAQTSQNKVLKLDSAKIASRQISVERAKVQPKFLPPKAETAKNPNIGNGGNSGGTGTVFFVPPKAEPAGKPSNNGPVTAQFVPPKAEPVKTGGNGGNQVLRFEAPKSPRVSAQPTVQVATATPAQVALAPEVKTAPATTAVAEPKAEVATAPVAKVVAAPQKVVVTVPQGYYYAPRAYYGGYAPAQRTYGSYGGGYQRCH